MNVQNKLCLSLLATLSLVAGSASAATAHDEDEAPAPGLPAETHGYVPVPEEYYADAVFPACGTTVTLESGDVREVEQKVQVKHDGTTVVKYRGDGTVDLTAEPGGDLPDGGFIDELDVSGAGSTRISADGTTLVITLKGPSIVFPQSETDAATLADEGLPEILYFEHGTLTIEIVLPEDETAVEPESVEILKNTTKGAVDLCQALKASAEPSH
ncbi:hypothetical protein ACX80J_14550 [Arthrobacter sp. MDB2-24]